MPKCQTCRHRHEYTDEAGNALYICDAEAIVEEFDGLRFFAEVSEFDGEDCLMCKPKE